MRAVVSFILGVITLVLLLVVTIGAGAIFSLIGLVLTVFVIGSIVYYGILEWWNDRKSNK